MSATPEVSADIALTPAFKAMSPLHKWETLVLSGLIGTNEPWIEDMRDALREQSDLIERLVLRIATIEGARGRLREALGVAANALDDAWADVKLGQRSGPTVSNARRKARTALKSDRS